MRIINKMKNITSRHKNHLHFYHATLNLRENLGFSHWNSYQAMSFGFTVYIKMNIYNIRVNIVYLQ